MGCQLPKFFNSSSVFMGLLSEHSTEQSRQGEQHIKKACTISSFSDLLLLEEDTHC